MSVQIGALGHRLEKRAHERRPAADRREVPRRTLGRRRTGRLGGGPFGQHDASLPEPLHRVKRAMAPYAPGYSRTLPIDGAKLTGAAPPRRDWSRRPTERLRMLQPSSVGTLVAAILRAGVVLPLLPDVRDDAISYLRHIRVVATQLRPQRALLPHRPHGY